MSVNRLDPWYERMVLRVGQLTKAYSTNPVLRGIDLAVDAGEIVGLVGPNGAGKTTLLNVICGLTPADTGVVEIGGFDIRTDRRRAVELLGFASQELAIYMTRSVRENLVHFARLAGLRRPELLERLEAATAELGLVDFLERRASQLSGGEKRRLHVAIALLRRTPLLILDEPTANVDVDTRRALINVVQSLADRGTAICYSTHYLAEIEELGARVVMIDRGSIIADGAVSDLLRRHGSEAIEVSFLGDAPSIEVPGAAIRRAGTELRIVSLDGIDLLPSVMQQIGGHANQIKSVNVLKPSLESVYLTLRGEAYPVIDAVGATT